MSKEEIELIGKNVKDMYGAFVGKVLGTITDTDGSIQTVGIECGSEGLKQVPYEQLVVQGDVVIFIPKWRLDSQRLLREKSLTVRRLKALIDIVSENDDMQDDASIIHEKYKSKLSSLEETEKHIKITLANRLAQLDDLLKSVKVLIFDAKVQFKSNEISESKFELVRTHTSDIIEHITHEKDEINNIQERIEDLTWEDLTSLDSPKQQIQHEAVSYLDDSHEVAKEAQTTLPEPPTNEPEQHAVVPAPTVTFAHTPAKPSPQQPQTNSQNADESDWLSRMEAQ